MTKVFRCRELVPDCDFEARGESDDAVLQEAAAHAKNAHDMHVTAELAQQVRAAIREE